ncbi:MAG: type II toxin-antitoxin system RelE/ParE family toxin [Deltaproteobacteria bacterium]|nr:type II toxin-antitoxin system RelE/ParE family toxin [Deltaproteobacteria bacterium]MBI3293101.1 type II toxin-antitoxin system RelE/ParE family toxin [Deltaproteobacteria bacterium]
MIKSIKSKTTQDIFDGLNSKEARKLPGELHKKAWRLLDLMNGASRLEDLKIPPGNRLEALSGNLKGFHSVRINDQWRIVFRWKDGNAEDVEIVDYH